MPRARASCARALLNIGKSQNTNFMTNVDGKSAMSMGTMSNGKTASM